MGARGDRLCFQQSTRSGSKCSRDKGRWAPTARSDPGHRTRELWKISCLLRTWSRARRDAHRQGRGALRARTGKVTNSAIGRGSTLPDQRVVDCIVNAFYQLDFPEPEGALSQSNTRSCCRRGNCVRRKPATARTQTNTQPQWPRLDWSREAVASQRFPRGRGREALARFSCRLTNARIDGFNGNVKLGISRLTAEPRVG